MSTPTAAPVSLPSPDPHAGPPRVLSCAQCATRITHTSRMISTAFRGYAGRAALFTETRNVALDPPSILLMESGAYTIQEFVCQTCDAYLGWRFLRAHDGPELWKEGHFVLELELVQEEEDEEDAARGSSAGGDALLRDGQSPVQSRAAQEAAAAAGLHKRTTSVDPRPPKGVRQGVRSTQAGSRRAQDQGQRRLDVDELDSGPFWKPR